MFFLLLQSEIFNSMTDLSLISKVISFNVRVVNASDCNCCTCKVRGNQQNLLILQSTARMHWLRSNDAVIHKTIPIHSILEIEYVYPVNIPHLKTKTLLKVLCKSNKYENSKSAEQIFFNFKLVYFHP